MYNFSDRLLAADAWSQSSPLYKNYFRIAMGNNVNRNPPQLSNKIPKLEKKRKNMCNITSVAFPVVKNSILNADLFLL